jgi:hypothetical protein
MTATATVITGTKATAEWCTACKAYTRVTGAVLMLTPGGVSTVGTWAWCEVCDDPADQDNRRFRHVR